MKKKKKKKKESKFVLLVFIFLQKSWSSIDWIILMTYQPAKGYFMPRG